MKVGIVGLGKMGLLHSSILNSLEDVDIVAISDKEDIIKNHIKSTLPNVRVYDDYQNMFSKEDLDLVYITTPVRFHIPIALECVKKNINFFVEKPLGLNKEQCKELYNASKGKSVISGVGYSKRFLDTFSKSKEIINSGILGDLLYFKSSVYISQIFSKGRGWRFSKDIAGGGVLLDLGAHLIDLLQWYFGDIKTVSCNTKSYYSDQVEDFAHCFLNFKSGLTGFIDTSWSIRGYRVPEITIEIHGSNGVLLVNDDNIKLKLDKPTGEYKGCTTQIHKQALYTGVIIDVAGQEYTKEDVHMVNCVKEKKQNSINIFEASKTQSIIDALYTSSYHKREKDVEYLVI